MKIQYTDIDIHFVMDELSVHALNIIFEQFTRVIPSHSHGSDCYEIHYIPAGSGRLKVDEIYYDLSPNTLFVTGPHVMHAQSPLLSDPMQEYCVYLRFPGASRSKKLSALLDAFLSTGFWIGQDVHGIHFLMQQLFDELKCRYTGYQNQVELLLSQLIICVVRNYEQKKKPEYRFARKNLYHSKSMIIEEYFLYEYRTLSLDALASRLNLSARQTQRLLQNDYGKTFQQKKTEARMSIASILLGDKSRSIASIAEELGYASAEHFSSAFKKYYQVSPGNYRKGQKVSLLSP
ncbi:MAG: AraC family transcriptional regulator [Lachnospiraceae bacterium]